MLSPRIFKQIVYENASSRHVRIRPKSPSSKVFFSWTLDPQAVGMFERILSKLEQRSPLHVSRLHSDSKMSSENNRRQGNCSFDNTSMAVKTMVFHAAESPVRQASSITTQSTNVETAIVSNILYFRTGSFVWPSGLCQEIF